MPARRAFHPRRSKSCSRLECRSTTRSRGRGELEIKDRWPGIEVASAAWEVHGGQTFATLNGERPVCSTVNYGKGLVMVVSCGMLFNDFSMGNLWSKDPTPAERTRYDVLFAILRRLVQDEMPVRACSETYRLAATLARDLCRPDARPRRRHTFPFPSPRRAAEAARSRKKRDCVPGELLNT